MTRRRIGGFILVALGALAGLSLDPRPVPGQRKAVSKPDLASLWILDKSKSSKGVVADLTVLIEQQEPEIKITRRAGLGSEERVDNLVYYSDGRGETNTIMATTTSDGQREIRSVTKWEGDKLMIRSPAKVQRSRDGHSTGELGRIEKWQVSKDGLLYWITSSTWEGVASDSVPAFALPNLAEIKRVFRRKQ
jgi:hypothetical protein